MEIPAVVLLYAVLLAGAVGALFYVFLIYDGAVHSINYHACLEAAYLLEVALQRAMVEPGNYTAKINLYYPAVIRNGNITVGIDTRNPATCPIEAPADVDILDSTGTTIVVEKRVTEYTECRDLKTPRLGKQNDRYILVTSCSDDIQVEKPEIRVFLS